MTSTLGDHGEDLAAEHLEGAGYEILARNWRPAGVGLRGELDLVARRGDVIAFVEVKTRRDDRFGGPFAAVTRSKRARIRALATAWLQTSGVRAPQVRFDVVGVHLRRGDRPVVQHLAGAF